MGGENSEEIYGGFFIYIEETTLKINATNPYIIGKRRDETKKIRNSTDFLNFLDFLVPIC